MKDEFKHHIQSLLAKTIKQRDNAKEKLRKLENLINIYKFILGEIEK